ncbi:AAA family ATPase [Streptomyces sp. NPDC059850]|uniref:AAA family ATPase n=1 Tax=Streptomyces sp. NPDC059850 TaxID=3346970 RepID=UPI00365451AB
MPRQLPADVRGFVNRADELHRLDAILAERDGGDSVVVALCVVAGTAGAGKTSLALRWAHQVKAHFPDGQLYVNLRGYDPGEPVTAQEALHRFLTGLGVPANAVPTNTESAAGLFRSLLADRRILIVLDNAAAAAQVRPLLPGHSGCLVVVTSRGRLSGLSVRDGAHRITLGTLPELEAVALLRAVTSGYRPEDNAEKLAELARLCARLPLALRIAAERAACHPHMGLDELIADLRDESGLWEALSTGEEQDADAVRSVFAWSYRALSPDAARLFRLLGLHPGPEFGIEAVAALAGVSVRKARQGLDVLVGAHLLEHTGPDRFDGARPRPARPRTGGRAGRPAVVRRPGADQPPRRRTRRRDRRTRPVRVSVGPGAVERPGAVRSRRGMADGGGDRPGRRTPCRRPRRGSGASAEPGLHLPPAQPP